MSEFLKLKKKPLHLQDLSKSELHKGQSEEREHTTNPRIATQIASDHLHEDKKYYTHLEHMDKQGEEHVQETGSYRRSQLSDGKGGLVYDNFDKKIPVIKRLGQVVQHSPALIKHIKEDGLRGGLQNFKENASIIMKDKWQPLHHVYHEDMNKQAFERGFLKAALANNIAPLTAVELVKQAGQLSESAGRMAGSVGDLQQSMMPALTAPIPMMTGYAGGVHGAVNGAALGALGGGLGGGLLGYTQTEDKDKKTKNALLAALAGAGLGGATGMGIGGATGGYMGYNQGAKTRQQLLEVSREANELMHGNPR